MPTEVRAELLRPGCVPAPGEPVAITDRRTSAAEFCLRPCESTVSPTVGVRDCKILGTLHGTAANGMVADCELRSEMVLRNRSSEFKFRVDKLADLDDNAFI